MQNRALTVAVAFDLNFRHAAGIFSGAADYVRENRLEWRLIPLQYGFETTLMDLAQSGQLNGAIGTFISDSWIERLTQLKVGAVNLFNFSHIRSVPSVCVDDYKIGQTAAKHLLAQGATHFAFLGPDSIHYTQLRRAGFTQALGSHRPTELRPGPPLREQIRELKQSTGRLGILCTSDRLARELIISARRQDFEAGRDFLVVAIDDDPSESIFANIGISSFKLPSRRSGRLAATILRQILTGTPPAPTQNIAGEALFIPRASSLATNRARLAQAAVNYINDNLSNPELDVESLARNVGTSRRVLELACKEQLDNSPYKIIAQARLDLSRQLLSTTSLPIMEIGRRSGYPEPHHYSAWFKSKTAQSPKAYRARHQKA